MHVHYVRLKRGPTKMGAPQTKECQTAERHFLAVVRMGLLYGVLRYLEVHLVQHDILWPWAGEGSAQWRNYVWSALGQTFLGAPHSHKKCQSYRLLICPTGDEYYRYTRFLSFCLLLNFFLSLEIRLNSVVQSKQSVDQKRPLAPPAAWRPEAMVSGHLG